MCANCRIVLVEPLYPINLGLIARAMKNFGLSELYLVRPKTPINSNAYIFSSHAKDVLKSIKIVDSLKHAFSDISLRVCTTGKTGKRNNIVRSFIYPEELARELPRYGGKVAIIFGREDIGLTNEELKACDIIVNIPANDEYPILNISHAVAIILYEIFKAKKYSKKPKINAPISLEIDILISYLKKISKAINYPLFKEDRTIVAFKRILGRSFISKEEVYILMGFFRKIFLYIKK